MSYFQDLKKIIEEGQEGKNKGISLGMPRLDKFITLRKKIFYMIMGSTGSGKSSLLYDAFILNPLEILNKENNNKNIKYILFSMERSKSFIQAKWLSRRIFLDTGQLIPLNILLNWYGDKLNSQALELIDTYEEYFNFLQEHIDIYEGARTPNDIFRIVKEYSEKHGNNKEINQYKKEYIANNSDEEVYVAIDHMGLTKTTKDYSTKKQAIDRVVEHCQYFRDHLGYSDIIVNQLNRDMNNPIYAKMDSFEPHLDNAKESGTAGEASDCVISIFDPIRFNTNDRFYGDVNAFKSPESGHKYFRNIKILKNSYGIDDASIGVVFQGETGRFSELPRSSVIKDTWTDYNYETIFNNSYFLK